MSVGAGETSGTQRFANYGAAWLPVLPLLVLVMAILAGVDLGVVVLLLLATLVALGISLLVALSPGVVIDGERLAVPGREDRRRRGQAMFWAGGGRRRPHSKRPCATP